MWKIVDSGPCSAEENMALDTQLLAQLQEKTLHFYRWQGACATHGYFTNPSKLLNIRELSKNQIQIAKRPTGGGVIFHLSDFAFSLLIPANDPLFSDNTLENYRRVNNWVLKAISLFLGESIETTLLEKTPSPEVKAAASFCMANPTIYDVVYKGMKIGGAAQRKTKKGLLHQGTISLAPPPWDLLSKIILEFDTLFPLMQKTTFPLIGAHPSSEALEKGRDKIQHCLLKVLEGDPFP